MVCAEAPWAHAEKKTTLYKERDEQLRAAFQGAIATFPPEAVAYVDETGIDRHMDRPYAWSPKGVPAPWWVPGRRYERTGIVAAQLGGRVVAPMQYGGTMDAALFESWFGGALLPCIGRGRVIVMDNARFHRKATLCEMAHQNGCLILFLPPYSPDLNPIERLWAWIKARLRKVLRHFDSLDKAITDCFKAILFCQDGTLLK